MRKHRRRSRALLLTAALLVGGAVAVPAPAAGHSGGEQAPANEENFYRLRQCESGDNYGANTGNGYYGAYQFTLSTWQGLGYDGYPHEHPPEIQDEATYRLWQQRGWDPWPYCADRLGFR